MEFIAVGMGGFIGAIARYLVYLAERSIGPVTFPMGTLMINLLGCFLAGVILALVERLLPTHPRLILFVSMGVISSFTTFSTYCVETLYLIRSGQFAFAIMNVLLNIIFGISAVCLGKYCFTA
jgi:fluoride exporter